MKVCPKCGHKDSMIWKPLFWKLYWEYTVPLDFIKEIHALEESRSKTISSFILGGEPKKRKERKFCERGNFYYHFEDDFYYYKISGKTRKMIHRFPKGWEELANKKLYEKTPSEKGQDDIFQKKLMVNVE